MEVLTNWLRPFWPWPVTPTAPPVRAAVVANDHLALRRLLVETKIDASPETLRALAALADDWWREGRLNVRTFRAGPAVEQYMLDLEVLLAALVEAEWVRTRYSPAPPPPPPLTADADVDDVVAHTAYIGAEMRRYQQLVEEALPAAVLFWVQGIPGMSAVVGYQDQIEQGSESAAAAADAAWETALRDPTAKALAMPILSVSLRAVQQGCETARKRQVAALRPTLEWCRDRLMAQEQEDTERGLDALLAQHLAEQAEEAEDMAREAETALAGDHSALAQVLRTLRERIGQDRV